MFNCRVVVYLAVFKRALTSRRRGCRDGKGDGHGNRVRTVGDRIPLRIIPRKRRPAAVAGCQDRIGDGHGNRNSWGRAVGDRWLPAAVAAGCQDRIGDGHGNRNSWGRAVGDRWLPAAAAGCRDRNGDGHGNRKSWCRAVGDRTPLRIIPAVAVGRQRT
ncbi:hypothetical protein BGY98DRAFT_992464 [Russula aff. rugulosa BPL654]|nr:hypothetical protein BGY98DRAFT_992464 [Russula aff. rugulosa BPL654]